MIELLFSDSAAGSLAYVKEKGNDRDTKGKSVKITTDNDGKETCEEFEFDIPPYTGPTVPGSRSDIMALWLLADVGDVSDMTEFKGRTELWREIFYIHEYEQEAVSASELAEPMKAAVRRLVEASAAGEPVRIWVSDAPGDTCGYYWAMHILKDTAGPVTVIKEPLFLASDRGCSPFYGLGELSPEHFPALLSYERPVEPKERQAIAAEWEKLATENAPLRAVINGQLRSVPADFYDDALYSVIGSLDKECTVAMIIGTAMARGCPGVYDWWYARRLRCMLEAGVLAIVREHKRFYKTIVKPAARK